MWVKNEEKSWERQDVYTLPNGWEVTVSFNPHYGLMVSRIEYNGVYWHCSDGLRALPEQFSEALNWVETVVQSADIRLMRPQL